MSIQRYKLVFCIFGARTIKFGDSKDLKTYCKCIIEGSRIMKTETIRNTINPTWNQNFEIEITKGKEIQFEIYEEKKSGQDVCLGEGKISLPEFYNNETEYFIVQFGQYGSFYAHALCVSGGLSKKHKPLDFKAVTYLQISFNDIFYNHAIIPRDIEKEKYEILIGLESNASMRQLANFYLPDPNKPDRKNEVYWIRSKVNNDIRFIFMTKPLKKNDLIELTEGKYTVPDFFDGESVQVRIPTKNHCTFSCTIESLKGVYNMVNKKQKAPLQNTKPMTLSHKYEIFIDRVDEIQTKSFEKIEPYVTFKTNGSRKERATISCKKTNSPIYKEAFKCKIVPGSDIEFQIVDETGKGGKGSGFLGDAILNISSDLLVNRSYPHELKISKGKESKMFVEVVKMREVSQFYLDNYLNSTIENCNVPTSQNSVKKATMIKSNPVLNQTPTPTPKFNMAHSFAVGKGLQQVENTSLQNQSSMEPSAPKKEKKSKHNKEQIPPPQQQPQQQQGVPMQSQPQHQYVEGYDMNRGHYGYATPNGFVQPAGYYPGYGIPQTQPMYDPNQVGYVQAQGYSQNVGYGIVPAAYPSSGYY